MSIPSAAPNSAYFPASSAAMPRPHFQLEGGASAVRSDDESSFIDRLLDSEPHHLPRPDYIRSIHLTSRQDSINSILKVKTHTHSYIHTTFYSCRICWKSDVTAMITLDTCTFRIQTGHRLPLHQLSRPIPRRSYASGNWDPFMYLFHIDCCCRTESIC